MPSTYDRLTEAIKFQRAGKLHEAARLYTAVLNDEPHQPDALHLLGLVAHAQGDHRRAVELIEQALAHSPNNPVYLGNLGVARRHTGDIDGAIKAYTQAIALEPNHLDAHYNIGKAFKLRGENEAAEHHYRRAIAINRQKEGAWLGLIALYVDQEDFDRAIAVGQQAAEACPRSADVYLNLGSAYRRSSQNDCALACYRRACELRPRDVDAMCRLASLLITKHELVEGEKWLLAAQALEPESVHVLNALSLLHQILGNATAAVEVSQRAIGLYPDKATAFSHLSSAQRKLGMLTESLEAIERSLELESRRPEGLVVKAGALMGVGRLDEALECFQAALSIRPSYKDAHDGYLMCWQYHPEVTPERLLEEHLNWNQKQAEMVPARSEFSARPASAQRLRLGFVSADLGAHPVGYFTLNVLESLDRDRFAIHVYSDRVGRDAVAQRIEKRADQWLDSAAMSDESLSQRIGEDRIDILFDLAGHTAQNRLLVFARRAAPIQITWAGYVGTTGVKNMDYLLADRFHLPPGQEKHYCERVLRMPHGYICYSPPADSPPVVPLPALTNGYVTFGAMCNPTKVNAAVLSAWGRVLQAVPGSRLLLCYKGWPDVTNRRRVVEALDAFGAGERVEFRQRSGPAEVMASYGEVDLALDTFPYSGGLTACEAIWMGVPTITLPGSTFAGRHSLSHLSNVGLVQCIASDLDDYVARAVEQASRLDELAELRKGLRNQMAASPLCDGARFAADFAQVLEQAVREFNG